MAEEIVLKVDVELESGAKSLRSLKQEFKETQKELDGAIVGSEKYLKTLQKLGDLKNEMGDLKATINAFDGGNRIGALSNAIGGVASGFQAAVGATALFGSESEELNKTLLKVQATMAFAEGIKGVMAMGESFAALNAVIAANPIVAVTVAVVALTAAVTSLILEQDKEIEQMRKLAEEREKLRAKTRNAEINLEAFKRGLRTNELQQDLEVAKAKGKSEQELYNLEKKLIQQRIADLKYVREARGKYTKEEALQVIQLQNDLEVLDASYTKKRIDNAKKRKDALIKNQEEASAMLKKLDDEDAKAAEDAKSKQLENTNKFIENEANNRKRSLQEQRDFELQKLKEDYQNTTGSEDAKAAYKLAKAKIQNDYLNKLAEETFKKVEDDFGKDEKAKQDAFNNVLLRHQLERDAMATTQALSDTIFAARLNGVKKGSEEEQKILKKQFEINKKFQIATAIMAGAQSIMAITSVPDFTLGIQSSLRIAAQVGRTLAQIATIRNTQFQGGGGGSTPTPATPTTAVTPTATQAPVVNTPISATTQLNPDGTVRQTQGSATPIVKAVVVESDITQAQKKVSNIKDVATFS